MDRETGMYYYGARYYDPRISIFISVDPLAEEFPNYGGYVYTMNNPINLVDPTGMAPEENDGWIIKKSRRDGNTIVMYDSSVNNMEEAKRKGYRDVEGVLETGYFIGEDDVWRLEDNAMIYGENSGIVKDVGYEGYRANDGTFFQENNMLKSTASGLQDGGDMLTIGGLTLGAVSSGTLGVLGGISAAAGEVMSKVGLGIELIIDANEGKLTTEKFITKTATSVLIPRFLKKYDNAKKPVDKAVEEAALIGLDRTLDEGRKNDWKRK